MEDALKLIESKLNLNAQEARNKANKFIKLISNKYPSGCGSSYFTFPGFEKLKNHKYPLIMFRDDLKLWELSVNTDVVLFTNNNFKEEE